MIVDSIGYFLGRFFAALLNFLIFLLLATTLGAEGYGIIASYLAIFPIISALTGSWIAKSLLRFYNKFSQEKRLPILYANCWISYLVTNSFVFMILAMLVIGKVIVAANATIVFIFIMQFPLKQIVLESLRIQKKVRTYAANLVVESLLSYTTLFVFTRITANPEVNLLLLVYILPSTIYYLLMAVNHANLFSLRFKDFTLLEALKLLKFGLPLALSSQLGVIIVSGTKLFLLFFLGAASAGIFSGIYDFCHRTIFVVMSIINLVTYPYLQTAWDENREAFRLTYRQTFFMLVFIGAMFVTIYTLNYKYLLTRFLSSEYVISVWGILIMSLAVVLNRLQVYYFEVPYYLTYASRKVMVNTFLISIVGLGLSIIAMLLSGSLYLIIISMLVSYAFGLWLTYKRIPKAGGDQGHGYQLGRDGLIITLVTVIISSILSFVFNIDRDFKMLSVIVLTIISSGVIFILMGYRPVTSLLEEVFNQLVPVKSQIFGEEKL